MGRSDSFVLDLVFLGRSRFYIFGIMLLEVLSIGVILLISAPIEIPEPLFQNTSAAIFSVLSFILVVVLYLYLSYLGSQTYSSKLHNPITILYSVVIYFCTSLVVISLYYFLFVYQFVDELPSDPVEFSLGLLTVTGFANILVLSFLAHDFWIGHDVSKSKYLNQFFKAVDSIQRTEVDDLASEPDDLIEAGNQLLSGLESSRLESTDEIASDLEEWLEAFENKDLRGQKKMLGGYLDSNTEFSIWEEHYEEFQRIEESLNYLDNSAAYKIGLSVKRISVGTND